MPRRVLRGEEEEEEEALLIIMIAPSSFRSRFSLGKTAGWLAGYLFKTRTTAGWRGDLEFEKEQSPNHESSCVSCVDE